MEVHTCILSKLTLVSLLIQYSRRKFYMHFFSFSATSNLLNKRTLFFYIFYFLICWCVLKFLIASLCLLTRVNLLIIFCTVCHKKFLIKQIWTNFWPSLEKIVYNSCRKALPNLLTDSCMFVRLKIFLKILRNWFLCFCMWVVTWQ